LPELPCVTKSLRIHGYQENSGALGSLEVYGSDAPAIRALCAETEELAARLHPQLPCIAAEVVWAARREMARTVEDILARRTRALFLNANAAAQMAEPVARLLAGELDRDPAWIDAQVREFRLLAEQYRVS
jgi:glycerol-3-phosphate dehydrogenase